MRPLGAGFGAGFGAGRGVGCTRGGFVGSGLGDGVTTALFATSFANDRREYLGVGDEEFRIDDGSLLMRPTIVSVTMRPPTAPSR